jgi:hypothetical protein
VRLHTFNKHLDDPNKKGKKKEMEELWMAPPRSDHPNAPPAAALYSFHRRDKSLLLEDDEDEEEAIAAAIGTAPITRTTSSSSSGSAGGRYNSFRNNNASQNGLLEGFLMREQDAEVLESLQIPSLLVLQNECPVDNDNQHDLSLVLPPPPHTVTAADSCSADNENLLHRRAVMAADECPLFLDADSSAINSNRITRTTTPPASIASSTTGAAPPAITTAMMVEAWTSCSFDESRVNKRFLQEGNNNFTSLLPSTTTNLHHHHHPIHQLRTSTTIQQPQPQHSRLSLSMIDHCYDGPSLQEEEESSSGCPATTTATIMRRTFSKERRISEAAQYEEAVGEPAPICIIDDDDDALYDDDDDDININHFIDDNDHGDGEHDHDDNIIPRNHQEQREATSTSTSTTTVKQQGRDINDNEDRKDDAENDDDDNTTLVRDKSERRILVHSNSYSPPSSRPVQLLLLPPLSPLRQYRRRSSSVTDAVSQHHRHHNSSMILTQLPTKSSFAGATTTMTITTNNNNSNCSHDYGLATTEQPPPEEEEDELEDHFVYKGITANPPDIVKRGITRGNLAVLHRKAWLEVSDKYHRYGKHLRLYYRHWESIGFPTNSFFDWLDSKGEASGCPLPEIDDCPRTILDTDTVLYITNPDVTEQYALHVAADPATGRAVFSTTTTTNSDDGEDGQVLLSPVCTGESGWIFVLRDNRWYGAPKITTTTTTTTSGSSTSSSVAAVASTTTTATTNGGNTTSSSSCLVKPPPPPPPPQQQQRFHHSSFFGGKAVAAAGIFITNEHGHLTKLYPHSGHYRPGEAHMQRVLFFFYHLSVDLRTFDIDTQQMEHVARDGGGDVGTKNGTTKNGTTTSKKASKLESLHLYSAITVALFLAHKAKCIRCGLFASIHSILNQKEGQLRGV